MAQAQLERLAADKAAQQMLLERQVSALQQELGRAQAAAAQAGGAGGYHMRHGGGMGGGHDIIPMDALGEPYQRLARHNKLGGAVTATANFLDRTAASGMQIVRNYPLARLILFIYIVLIHLYVYFLLARMQRQALMLHGGLPGLHHPGGGGAAEAGTGAGAHVGGHAAADLHAGRLP